MNISSSIGSPGPISVSSNTFFPITGKCRIRPDTQKQQNVFYNDVKEKSERLIPSRKKEELTALENLKRRLDIVKPVIRQEMKFVANCKKIASEDSPNLIKKIMKNCSNRSEDIHTLDKEFINDALLWHNVYRDHHVVPPLKIDNQLCKSAQMWANKLAHTNMLFYDTDKTIGQNIFCRLPNDAQTDISPQEIVSSWYSSYRNYKYGKESKLLHVSINSGTFTQVIWKSSTLFGVGRARSRTGKIFIVAHYKPAGNIRGFYEQNVLPPAGTK